MSKYEPSQREITSVKRLVSNGYGIRSIMKEVSIGRVAATRLRNNVLNDLGKQPGEITRTNTKSDEEVNSEITQLYQTAVKQASKLRLSNPQGRVVWTPKDTGPIGLAFLADVHLGTSGCDYEAFEKDIDLILNTPGLYCIVGGDLIDNHIKHASAALAAELNPGDQWDWMFDILTRLKPKLVSITAGNHDCNHKDSELLTKNKGWIHYTDIEIGDLTYSINTETGKAEWVPVENVIVKHAEKLMEYSNNTTSFSHTPGHRVLYRKDKKGTINSHIAGEYDYLTMDEFTSSIEGRFHIQNSKSLNNNELENISDDSLYLYYQQEIIPEWVTDLSDRQFDVFLSGLANGSINKDSYIFRSRFRSHRRFVYGTKKFLDNLQIACICHGYRTSIYNYKETQWRLNISNIETTSIEASEYKNKVSINEYNNTVWCITNKNSNFMYRHNGKACFTGNCWTHTLTQYDPLKQFAKYLNIPYDKDESLIKVKLNNSTYTISIRHKYRFKSSLNASNSVKQLWTHGDHNFDVGVVCHDHIATCEPFIRHGIERWSIRPGSYQVVSDFARTHGFHGTVPVTPAVIMLPNKRELHGFANLDWASQMMKSFYPRRSSKIHPITYEN